MLVYIYNSQMSMLGVVEEITSLIWTRRYWDVGDFKLLVPFNATHNQLLQTGNIVIRHGDTEAAEIQYVSISKNLEGYEIIEAQGKFLSHWLSKRLVTKQIVNTVATNQELIRRMVDENCINTDAMRVIPNLSLHDDDSIDGVNVTYTSEEYCNLLDAVIECAQSSKIGFRTTTNREHGTHEFSVYKGRDYTADNAEGNPPCIFSPDYDNVLEQEYTVSTERFITTAYVQGEEKDDDSAPALAIVGEEYSGLERRELYVSGGDIKQTYKDDNDQEVTLTDEEYRQALLNRGEEKVEQYPISQAFSSEINAGANLVYRDDFDIGDRVTCFNKTWNVRIDARITEVSEISESTGDRLEITFGESIPSVYRQLKAMTKGV